MFSIFKKYFSFYFSLIFLFNCVLAAPTREEYEKSINLKHTWPIYASINPVNHRLDINWFNINQNDSQSYTLLITNGPVSNLTTEDFLDTTKFIIDDGVSILDEISFNTSSGTIQSEVKFEYSENRRVEINKGCYAFWYHLVVNDALVSSNCITTQSTWMSDMRKLIEGKKFRQLFIPGTHDSASYKYNFDPTSQENLVTRYALTQDDDIYSQLIHGIRYIDLRVGHYKSTKEKFWANHGITKQHPLSDVLSQIKQFTDATNEIVIVDFQEFPVGFGKGIDLHKQFAFFLFQEMSEYAVDSTLNWDSTIGDIWRSGKRIILAYDHISMVQDEGLGILWPSVRQRWGKVKENSAKLLKFLKDSRANLTREFQTSRPFAEMAEFTPEAVDVITNRLGGLRRMADRVNFEVTKLYTGDFGHGANVVAVDFYRATNIVDIAINWNFLKFSNSDD